MSCIELYQHVHLELHCNRVHMFLASTFTIRLVLFKFLKPALIDAGFCEKMSGQNKQTNQKRKSPHLWLPRMFLAYSFPFLGHVSSVSSTSEDTWPILPISEDTFDRSCPLWSNSSCCWGHLANPSYFRRHLINPYHFWTHILFTSDDWYNCYFAYFCLHFFLLILAPKIKTNHYFKLSYADQYKGFAKD